ncbi:MAG: S-layer homology domain-containing protein [Phascolarctobacterium sp.]|nr:S-layer homology domain-containing protein [Phascolarctobacterium sp.]
MKKSLVLAMAMALGVTASAYAANPFSDVPAGHWAYDSVAKLAQAGVVDGYADGAFDGEKLMTRYEMAQIVAKAMAKGANVDKLAAEFADELDTLGVRVANLEKKADAVKISGEVRAHYESYDNEASVAELRTRLWITGQVNEDWSYTGMLENIQELAHSDEGEEGTDFARAYLEGKVGGLDVLAGRWNEVTSSGNVLDADVDGIKVSYGDNVKVYAAAMKAAEGLIKDSSDRIYVVGAETTIGAVDVYANYFKANAAEIGWGTTDADGDGNPDADKWDNKEIYNIGLGLEVAKDLALSYDYMWGDKKVDETVSKDGWVARLDYKESDPAEAGTYGIHAQYFDQPINAYLSPTTDAPTFDSGYEGWNVGVDYTLAENIQLCVNYYDTEAKSGSEKEELIFSELYFFF